MIVRHAHLGQEIVLLCLFVETLEKVNVKFALEVLSTYVVSVNESFRSLEVICL